MSAQYWPGSRARTLRCREFSCSSHSQLHASTLSKLPASSVLRQTRPPVRELADSLLLMTVGEGVLRLTGEVACPHTAPLIQYADTPSPKSVARSEINGRNRCITCTQYKPMAARRVCTSYRTHRLNSLLFPRAGAVERFQNR